jgi:hypothetical protein
VHLYRTKHFLCIRRGELRLFRVDWSLVRLLVTKGIPMGLQMFVVSSSMIALTSLVNRFGSEETAAFNAAMQLWNYVQMPALAIGAAVSSMAAQNVGAGKWDRVDKVATTGVMFNFLIGGCLIAIIYLLERTRWGCSCRPTARHCASRRISTASFCGRSFVRHVHGAVRSGARHRRRGAAAHHAGHIAVADPRALCLFRCWIAGRRMRFGGAFR